MFADKHLISQPVVHNASSCTPMSEIMKPLYSYHNSFKNPHRLMGKRASECDVMIELIVCFPPYKKIPATYFAPFVVFPEDWNQILEIAITRVFSFHSQLSMLCVYGSISLCMALLLHSTHKTFDRFDIP